MVSAELRIKNYHTIEKQYARRDISGYGSPYDDPFEYRTIESVGMDEVYRLLTLAPFFDVQSGTDLLPQARAEFNVLVEFASSAYAPEHWLIAFKDGNPVGYIFPQGYWDVPVEGSIFAIGVVPEMQGRGYGKILHAKGLEILAQIGITSYVGSTETKNHAMIAIFLANDCHLSKVHTIEVDENGLQKIIS